MFTAQEISRFIHKERTTAKEMFEQGGYSLEFALGVLAGLNNLAANYRLGSLVEDLRNDVAYLGVRNRRDEKLRKHGYHRPPCADNRKVWR